MADLPLDVLDRVRVATPCPMRWEDMDGDGHVRHCGQCDLNVYNFSAMTRAEVAAVIADRGSGRLCATFYQRPDGTMITRDCPVGLRAARRRVMASAGRLAAVAGLALTAILTLGRRPDVVATPNATPVPTITPRHHDPRMIAGDICFPEEEAERLKASAPEDGTDDA